MKIPARFYIIGSILLVVIAIAVPVTVMMTQKQQNSSGQQPTTGSTPVSTPGSTTGSTSSTPAYDPFPLPVDKALYVSPSGSDSNDGSKDHPFATIQKAADAVTPGTTVHVLPGTYNESVLVETDGTANARIAFISDTKWQAKIHTTNSDDPWKTNADYIDIIGFDISSDGSRDGMVNSGSYDRTIGNRIHDIPGVCDDIGGSGVTDGNFKAHDDDIIGNVVFNIGNTYPKLCQYVHAIYHSNAGGVIANNIAYDNAGNGINLWHAASGTVVSNNLVFDNKEHGISIGTNTPDNKHHDGQDFIVSNNISIDNALLGIRERKGVGSAQYLNNIVYGNGDAAFGDENYDWPPSASGDKDVNTITQNVLFVNFKADGTGNYQLQPNSPAMSAGTNTGAPATDINGTPRPQGKIDIGPYQS